jgi:hypothetical protein
MPDPHEQFLASIGPGLGEWEEPLPPVARHPDEFFEDRLGALIGAGSSREVFEVLHDPNAVIKKTKHVYPGANFSELTIWNVVRTGKWREDFGEVLAISETGRYLMMERLDNLSADERRQTRSYPDWLSDLKPENVGKTKGGKFKVRDYAMTKLNDALNRATTYRYAWQGPEPKGISCT